MDNQPNFFTGMARTIGICLWVKGMEVLTEKKESSDLKINDMPSGLPYDVDMSKYQTEDPNSTDSADTNVSAADSTDGDASASTNGSADSSASAADAEGKSSAN